MNIRHWVAAAAIALTAASASCGGGSKVDFVHEGRTTSVDAKTGTLATLTATKMLQDKSVLRASHARVYIGNYEGNLERASPSKEGEARVYFGLNGVKGTDHAKDPLPTGTYQVGNEWEKRAADFELKTFEGGKVVTKQLRKNLKGTVEVTKSAVDAIEGTIDVTSDDGSVKGSFSAKLPPKS